MLSFCIVVYAGVSLHDDVFIGPNVTFTNDSYPRSKKHLSVSPKTTVSKSAGIGANATLLADITIGKGVLIGAGW